METQDPLIKQGNEATQAIGTDSQGGAIYGFAGTPSVIPADKITPVTAITVPTSTMNSTIADGLVKSAGETMKTTQDYINSLTVAPTETENKYQSILDRVAALTSADTGRNQAFAQAKIDSGAVDLSKQLTDLNGQIAVGNASYAQLQAQEQADMAKAEGNSRSAFDYAGSTGAIARQKLAEKATKAAEIGMLAARAQATAGNLSTALTIAQNAVDAKYGPIEDEIKVKQAQLAALEPLLNKEEKIRSEALRRKYEDEKEKLAEEKANAKSNVNLALSAGIQTKFVNKNGQWFDTNTGTPFATREEFFKAAGVKSFEDAYKQGLVSDWTPSKAADFEFVQQARNKYPDAGILPTDSIDTVKAKLTTSRIYRKETYIAPPSGSAAGTLAGLSIVDPSTDSQVKQIISANIKGGYGKAFDAVKAKFGDAVAQKYDKVYQDVFNNGTTVDAAYNNTKLSSSSVPEQYKGALSVILGSDKFTKEQKASITQAVSSGLNPLSVIKNQAKNIMGQTNATKLDNYEVAKAQINDIQSALAQYYANGGKTDIFKGNMEKVINKLGEVKDPSLVALATQIQASLQQYRNAVSGTAYSVQEGADIASIFPGINKTQGLNNAIIKGRIQSLDSTIDAQYRSTLGDSYDLIKGTANSQSNLGLPQQMVLNGQILTLQPDGTYQ